MSITPSKRKASLQVYGKRASKRELPNTTPMFFPPTEAIDQTQQPPPLPPNKPAFKMTVEPDEETVNTFISFCEGVNPISRPDAIRYLKVKSNDVQAAFEAWFGGEDISSQEKSLTWDEGAWSQGKDGPGAGDGLTDPHLRPLLSSAAPTRPNSPSPAGRNSLHPSSKQQEDDDLAQAMAMSQGNEYFQQSTLQQESGIIGSGGQETQFGPANRNDYNPRDWAMVPAGPSTSGEIVPDTEVEKRVGRAGEPRMLKQLPSGGGEYLANLLTILVNVHGAREAMLMRERVKADYGVDGEWWKGHPVAMPKIVALGGEGVEGEGEGEGDQYDDLLAETQRLMAFLSASERGYGSAGALVQMEAIKSANTRSVRSNTMLELFMQTWAVAAVSKAGDESDLASLFTTTIGTNASEGMVDTDMTLIDMPVDANPDTNKSQDLLELLDGLLWDTSDPSVSSDNYIERPADVLVMRLRQRVTVNGNNQLKVVVPAEFYVDKYLREHIESTRATRAEMARGKKKVEKIEGIERKLRTWRNPKDGKEVDASKLVGHTLKYFEEEAKLLTPDADERAPQYQDITSKLSAVISSIDSKLTTLAEEKEKTLAAIASMSRAPPPGLKPEDQEYRYFLRGVATKPNITYVLAHEHEHDDDEDGAAEGDAFDDADDTTYPGMRWWRLEYEVLSSGLAAKVSKVRVGDYDVLRAVELEHEKAMLVYGSMEINEPPAPEDVEPLPKPLQEFVRRDNGLFATELETERNRPPAYQQSFDLTGANDADSGIGVGGIGGTGNGKRTSMDSTRVEGSGSPPPSPPDYDRDAGGFDRHPSFGLGPDITGKGYGDDGFGAAGNGYDGARDDEQVTEIRLDDVDEDGDVDEGVEMVEKVHGSLVPGLGAGAGGKGISGIGEGDGGSDVEMGDEEGGK